MYPEWTRAAAHAAARCPTQCPIHSEAGGGTEWGLGLDVPALQGAAGAESCFKCPKRRIPGEAGWYFVHFEDAQRVPGPCRLYVCPKDYLEFAESERTRWAPVAGATDHHDDHVNGSGAPGQAWPHENGSVAPQPGTACSADELITLLTGRGLAGWAFLVRDVAAGRVRRIHLRQLPADPEIRGALVTYLYSAGTAVTMSRVCQNHQRYPR
jgi:hypothetical protein